VRELTDLDAAGAGTLATIAAVGPRHGVRVIAACERRVVDVLRTCTFLDQFGTRLVRQTADEDESLALVGVVGAEELGSGGHVFLRLEGRVPIQGWAHRVSPEHLARLLRLMGTRARVASPSSGAPDVIDAPVTTPDPSSPSELVLEHSMADSPAAEPPQVEHSTSLPSVDRWPASPLIQQLRAAPIRIRCLGGREVWYGDRLLWPNGEAEADTSWELILLLALHRVTGVQSESLVDMLWGEETPKDPARALRQRRWRAREELRRLAPDLPDEPLPTDASRGTSQVYALNPAVIASDVHEFLELVERARTLPPTYAVQAYEDAVALYRGDLLDSSDVPTYSWLYDGAEIALTLRSDYRRLHQEARLRLAELLAAGPDSGLARAAELYQDLCAEDPEDERLWLALFKVHERACDVLGLESSVRRLRAALAELSEAGADPDSIQLPPNLDRAIQQIRSRNEGIVSSV
jgi:DNA-binding SARP family transcriptional activator